MDHLFLQGTLLDIYSIFSLNRDSFFSSSDLIIEDPFPNTSKNFQNLERENENNINFPRSLKGFRIALSTIDVTKIRPPAKTQTNIGNTYYKLYYD
jgi:hypothetical protein